MTLLLTHEQAVGIAKAKAILRGDFDTVLAALQDGSYVDDQPVVLARPSHVERVTCDAAIDLGAAPDLSPKWVQVAAEGVYNGYAGGAFTFDGNVFSQLVRNLRSDPAFVLGAGGVGVAPVCAWDFDHASAAFAADGTIPVTGAPAQGWVLDLDIRPGPNGLTLYALTSWLEPARSYILEGKYRWASVVVSFDCRDPKTNADIGARLDSIALTNSPFISGMVPLAASRGGVPVRQQTTGVTTMLSIKLPPGIKANSPEAQSHARIALSAIKLAAKAEVVTKGSPGDTNLTGPDFKAFENLTPSTQSDILNAARKLGFNGGTNPATCLAWLKTLGADVVAELDLDDVRAPLIVGRILTTLGAESQPTGTGLSPVVPMVPSPLSRQPLDATQQIGRNGTERAIAAMRAHSPRFAALSFAEQVHEASVAVQAGHVVVA